LQPVTSKGAPSSAPVCSRPLSVLEESRLTGNRQSCRPVHQQGGGASDRHHRETRPGPRPKRRDVINLVVFPPPRWRSEPVGYLQPDATTAPAGARCRRRVPPAVRPKATGSGAALRAQFPTRPTRARPPARALRQRRRPSLRRPGLAIPSGPSRPPSVQNRLRERPSKRRRKPRWRARSAKRGGTGPYPMRPNGQRPSTAYGEGPPSKGENAWPRRACSTAWFAKPGPNATTVAPVWKERPTLVGYTVGGRPVWDNLTHPDRLLLFPAAKTNKLPSGPARPSRAPSSTSVTGRPWTKPRPQVGSAQQSPPKLNSAAHQAFSQLLNHPTSLQPPTTQRNHQWEKDRRFPS